MSTTVASRVIRSSPHRDTSATWEFIVGLLTQGKNSEVQRELMSIAGVASAIIADQAVKNAAIVVRCDGPRTRIYCLYDDAAIEGSDAKEDSLGYDPLNGQWAVSLPCPIDDLTWVQRALKSKSTRVTARDMSQTLGEDDEPTAKSRSTAQTSLTLDVERYLKS